MLLMVLFSSGQNTEEIKDVGIPLIDNYTPIDYSSKSVSYGNQNYDVLLGNDGRMYFANLEGLLIFDGTNWIRVRLPGNAGVYSLAKARDGTIYVGGQNEIGYLSHNSVGELAYRSLLKELGDQSKDSFVAYKTFISKSVTYFLTGSDELYAFDQLTKKIHVINTPSAAALTRTSKEDLYSYQEDGLYALREFNWEKVKNSNFYQVGRFKNMELIDLPNDRTIRVSALGFFDLETEQKIEISSETEQWLNNSNLLSAKLINDKYISICTDKGLLITDFNGAVIQYLNEDKGLDNQMIYGAALDRSGLLWLSTDKGISAVEILSPFTIMDKRIGIEQASFILKHLGYLYLATSKGTLRINWNDLKKPFKNLSIETLDPDISRWLIKVDDDILSLGLNQTMVLANDRFEIIEGTVTNGKEKYWTGFAFENSQEVLLGSMTGKILHLSKETGVWKVKKELDPSINGINFMAQGDGNEIWLSGRKELWKVTYDIENSEIIEENSFGVEEGLPYGVDNYAFRIGGKATFSGYGGVYSYDDQSDRIIKDERFKSSIGDLPVLRMTEDKDGNVYCLSDGYLYLQKTPDGFEMVRLLNEKLANYNPFNVILIDSANALHPTANAIVHVDPTVKQSFATFKAKIVSVRSIGKKDSLYYGGFGGTNSQYKFNYQGNAVRFDFTSDYYETLEYMTYKWRLVGLDDEWSSWSSETSKDYTNLPHGDYTFEVVAKNVFFVESRPAIVHFSIATPWFFSYWAYLAYLLILSAFIWALVKLNIRRLEAEKKRLEGIIIDRTKEVVEQKDQLIQQDELKNRFFLNISHELRTPLTLSIGTVERTLDGKFGQLSSELIENLRITKRNNHRLLKMVNNILDVSKIQGGKIDLKVSLIHPKEVIDKVLDFFSSKFASKTIHIQVVIDSSTKLYLDKDKFETIMMNLMSNAYKFTPEGGRISIEETSQLESVTYFVKDTGIGIPEEHITNVFDRFYQTPHGMNDEGTGLGLALTKELVLLHSGTINVDSVPNQETTFSITFRKGKSHFIETDISLEPSDQSTKSLEDKYPLYENPVVNDGPIPDPTFEIEDLHILVVEDNPEMGKYIADILKDFGYHVSLAINGKEGLDFLSKQKPDLILTDWLMPEMNGFEMASEIKKSEELAFIPMIFLTARAHDQDKINVLNLGVDDYLFKPFNPEELLVRIKNLLFNKNHRAEYIEEQEIGSSEIAWKDFDSKLKQDIDSYIKENIKSEITGDDLAKIARHSERSLYRKVKANTGLSLMLYVKEYRLRQARSLLENKELPTVSEVSYAVGFNYLSHFTKSYKERFGKQPSAYLE